MKAELLIGLAPIMALGGVGIAPDTRTGDRGREAVRKEQLFRMSDAIDQFHVDKHKYPESLEELVAEGYLRNVDQRGVNPSRYPRLNPSR